MEVKRYKVIFISYIYHKCFHIYVTERCDDCLYLCEESQRASMLNLQVFVISLSSSSLDDNETDCSCSCFISDQNICSVDKIKRVALFAFILNSSFV